MKAAIKYAVAASALAFITACVGGSGSATVQVPTFALQTIYEKYLGASYSYSEVSSGTISSVTAAGYYGVRSTVAIASATFENSASLVVTETRTGTNNTGGKVSHTASELKYYYNLSKQRIGFTQRDVGASTFNNYGVIQGAATGFPASAKIGDSGNLYTMKIYSDATKTTLGATQNVAWALKAGQGSAAATLEILEVTTASGNPVTITQTAQYSIDQSNRMALIKELTDVKNGNASIASITNTLTRQ
jgi:hypothetical protein